MKIVANISGICTFLFKDHYSKHLINIINFDMLMSEIEVPAAQGYYTKNK